MQQVHPVDVVSQRLIDALHAGDEYTAAQCVADPAVDVNFVGAVCLKTRRAELVLNGEYASKARYEFEEFKSEVTAIFLAAHSGNLKFVRKLLGIGSNVNQKLFRGYAITAATRENHIDILEILIDGGSNQLACEEALLEASYIGRAKAVEVLLNSEMIRAHVAVYALVIASCRGFVDVVHKLIECGVDPNENARVLLRSSKPSLHANADCNALVAAIVNRQVAVVRLLLEVGVKIDTKVNLGAWSWDIDTGEEFRVGAGLAEPYPVTWCAVEYFEASGSILTLLLQKLSPNLPYLGRTLIHHAILCNNARAIDILRESHADVDTPTKTTSKTDLLPIHLASKLGSAKALQSLIDGGCKIDSKTESGETALMICAKYKIENCLKLLALAGADFGLVNLSGDSAMTIAGLSNWNISFQKAVLEVIKAGTIIFSSNFLIFSPLIFATRANDIEALTIMAEKSSENLNHQDKNGDSAAMLAAAAGNIEAFRVLVYAGADVSLQNNYGETAITLSEVNKNSNAFEKVIVEYSLKEGRKNLAGFYPLHRAASRGDLESSRSLLSSGYDVNALDSDGHTPLMLAIKGNYGNLCELLISHGAKFDIRDHEYDAIIRLTQNKAIGKEAKNVILDEISRKLVLGGALVKKHRKRGKVSPHEKMLKMIKINGVLSWGKSRKRNVICKEADLGPSEMFQWNRRKRLDGDQPGVFRVVTTKNKEVHFVCEGGDEVAQLWVRGIKLVTRENIFGKQHELDMNCFCFSRPRVDI